MPFRACRSRHSQMTMVRRADFHCACKCAAYLANRQEQEAVAMVVNRFLQRLGIEHPILLAPMAGAGGTPELAAAVSNAGGLGAWGGAYAKPDEIATAIRRIRQLPSRPFNITLFAGGYEAGGKVDPQPMVEIMSEA